MYCLVFNCLRIFQILLLLIFISFHFGQGIYFLWLKFFEIYQDLFHVPHNGSPLWMFHVCLKNLCVLQQGHLMLHDKVINVSIQLYILYNFYCPHNLLILFSVKPCIMLFMVLCNLILECRLKETVLGIFLLVQLTYLVNCPSNSRCLKNPNLWSLFILPIKNIALWLSFISFAVIWKVPPGIILCGAYFLWFLSL